jgi:hypothetical protein
MSNALLLLLRRRGRQQGLGPRSDDTGLLDILTNVVGVLALITALTSIFAAAGSLNIQAPMARRSQQGFHLLQASGAGIWDLDPALQHMLTLDRQRVDAVKRCNQQTGPSQQQCRSSLDRWNQDQQIGSVNLRVDHREGSLQRVGPPTVSNADLQRSSVWLDQVMAGLAKQRRSVFVVLESDGFSTYRRIKTAAQRHGVRLGWEPWQSNQPIHFWSNSGRTLTVQ